MAGGGWREKKEKTEKKIGERILFKSLKASQFFKTKTGGEREEVILKMDLTH